MNFNGCQVFCGEFAGVTVVDFIGLFADVPVLLGEYGFLLYFVFVLVEVAELIQKAFG